MNYLLCMALTLTLTTQLNAVPVRIKYDVSGAVWNEMISSTGNDGKVNMYSDWRAATVKLQQLDVSPDRAVRKS
ncbi:hypothetical protein Ocin01_17853 [Orchesella cincta]|uniref:Uncharacterized protein n=1 Tax=Orchesella cincta TaxID=48709 RepID=A0A1D2M770_ORCCI|nr:hypothetical protein Ocin01_17853 [Orchesella cincta]